MGYMSTIMFPAFMDENIPGDLRQNRSRVLLWPSCWNRSLLDRNCVLPQNQPDPCSVTLSTLQVLSQVCHPCQDSIVGTLLGAAEPSPASRAFPLGSDGAGKGPQEAWSCVGRRAQDGSGIGR